MEALLLQTGARLTPFGDEAREAPVRGQSLGEAMREAVRVAGAKATSVAPLGTPSPASGGERLIVTDDLWATGHLLRRFVKLARKRGGASVLAVEEGLFTSFTQALQDLGSAEVEGKQCRLYPVAWTPDGAWDGSDPTKGGGAAPLLVPLDVRPGEMKVHKVFDPSETLVLPLTHLACVRVGHWTHLLKANQMALVAWGIGLLAVEPWRALWALLRAGSLNKWRIMQKLVVTGKNCDIHPTAVVEASVLGDNVTVGAGAVVRFCHLGDGAQVSEGACALYSVLGKGAMVSRMGMVQSAVLYDKANTGQPGIQLCVIGRGSFVGAGVILGDFRLDGEVQVMHQGKLTSVGTNLMGCAVGHDVRILMRASFYPGRELPNGVTILGPTRDMVAKIPASLPLEQPLLAQDGTLVPYDVWRASLKAQA